MINWCKKIQTSLLHLSSLSHVTHSHPCDSSFHSCFTTPLKLTPLLRCMQTIHSIQFRKSEKLPLHFSSPRHFQTTTTKGQCTHFSQDPHMPQASKISIQLTQLSKSHDWINHEKPNSPFPSSFTSSTTHKQTILKISSKPFFQSKYMHGYQRLSQFCNHAGLSLYKYLLTSEIKSSTHQHFTNSQTQA
jgi:hypothetical protein